MKKGDEVKVYSGEYAGYYGTVQEVGEGKALVSHKEGFKGFWINDADFVAPLPPVVEPENE